MAMWLIFVLLDIWKCVIMKGPSSKKNSTTAGLTVKGYHVNLWLVSSVWSVSALINNPPTDLSSMHKCTVSQNKTHPADQLSRIVDLGGFGRLSVHVVSGSF